MRCGIVRWSWIVLALLAAHDVTHLADGGLDTSPGQLALVAIPQWIVLALVMGIIVRDPAHRRAAAIVLGASVAVGFALVHLVPFSPTAYWDLEPSALSWALVWVPATAGLVLVGLARPARSTLQPS
jgi:hypothetical protein